VTTTQVPTATERPRYNPHAFEAEWQRRWEEEGLYQAEDFSPKPKYYLLDFFPYPSGEGLHVGHSKNYVPTDAASRFLRMRGYNVLHPMGWDAFGLPAENEALIQQIHPLQNTARNVANFKRQMRMQGLSYDWSREINSSDPDYYKWTQWFFLLMYERGLAYRALAAQWWCPQCKTILANEQVENGYCWRHTDQLVERKELEQWYFRITDYAEELLRDLDTLDWPERIIAMQRNWIGRSEGAEIEFTAIAPDGSEHPIRIFTTRPDTIYGATFMVLSPEHPLVEVLTAPDHKARVVQYQQAVSRETEIARLSTEREKTGVPLGSYATNPFTDERIPIWIADYVLMGYGTGAIMAVPAHDERDFEFAKKYGLPIRQVVVGALPTVLNKTMGEDRGDVPEVFTGEGYMVNSAEFSGLPTAEGRQRIIEAVESRGIGQRAVTYRMRDWLVSRQRYWGAPIPIVYCDHCGIVPVPVEQLPVKLPDIDRFEPPGDGRSPLANVPEFVNTTCPTCGGPARRETDTLDTFVDSSWYYLRFTSPHEEGAPFDPAKARYWTPIDLYVGGAEHAVMHLLYFRFFAKVMNDAGLIDFREPAPRLLNQGMIHAPDGQRMSKSRHNVITPDRVIDEYGADSLRAYVMFMGPFDADANWDETGINGVWRWLNRVWDLAAPAPSVADETRSAVSDSANEQALRRALHKTIKKVTEDIAEFRFNTAISTLMEFTNLLHKERNALENTSVWEECIQNLLLLLAPIAPHMTEELWHRRGHSSSIHRESWPVYDPALAVEEMSTIVVQVNGKVRDTLQMPRGTTQAQIEAAAQESANVQRYLAGKTIVKTVFVPDRLINFVVR
jgi:leucyl-tRNA synthetase